eukprot:TRINITY_DN1494_c0_g2_i4.p1 TRINITY_DN1494_c0_g2~~TRINITY_DN1494_c0_g2_i4.p1  ORF type:complete len:632 (+),score=191.02 TRINITY_DN1494_c0_g2_i4:166-2061(+)
MQTLRNLRPGRLTLLRAPPRPRSRRPRQLHLQTRRRRTTRRRRRRRQRRRRRRRLRRRRKAKKKAEEEANRRAEEAKRQAEEESKKAAMASRAPEPMAAASPVVQTPPSQLQFPQQAVGFGGFMPPSYPNSPAPRTDGVSEREMEREVENVRREMIAKSEKQIEDVKSLMTQQLEALRNELRDERERRGADALKMSQQEMARDMDMKMKLTEKFSEFDRMRSELQSQYAEQVRQNQDLQRKILEKEMKMEVDFQRRLDEFRQKQDGQSKEVLLASLKKELDEEGRMAELAERSRQLKQEYERKLAQDHEDQQVRLNVLEQRMAAQHRANIIDLLRREQGDREWLQSLAWDHFSSLKRDESQARVQLLQTRQTATSLLAVAPGVGAQGQMVTAAGAAPASLAARGLNALSQHAARTPAPYTTKSFKKVYDVLERLDLAQNYAAVFAANEFDIMCLASLTEEDLNLLGITALGARKKLLAEAEVLRNEMTLNPPPPAAQERSGAVDDELTAEWCKERMARLACAHTPEAYDDVLAWDDAWREACALDADGEPSGHAGGHRGALLVQCISGAPPPRSRASPARKQLQQAAPLPPPSPPRPLPVPQHVLVFHTSDGIPYYYNEVTRETTWTPPAY